MAADPGLAAWNDVMVFHSYGLSMDAAGRLNRFRERLDDRGWITPVFPLLDRQTTRGDWH